jgi:Putative Ig domain
MEWLLRFAWFAVARSRSERLWRLLDSLADLFILHPREAKYGTPRKRQAVQFVVAISVLVLLLGGCNGGAAPAPKFTVTLPNGLQAIDAGESPTLTAMITNDTKGTVSWAIASGPGSLGMPTTSTANGVTTSTVVYTAPKTVNGPTQVTITITAGDPATYTLTFTVDAPPTLTGGSLPSGTEGTAYSETPTETGGAGVLTWSISAGSLPAGLTISSTTGAITGTPTGPAGTSNFTVQVVDQSKTILGSDTASAPFSLTINNYPPPTLSPASGALPGGTEGSSSSQAFNVTSGNKPYMFSISSGSVPAGLNISTGAAALVISGDPAGPPCSPCSFAVTVVDSSNPPQSATNNYTMVISQAPPPTISTSSLPAGVEGTTYNQTVTAGSGVAPYSFAITSGALPAGLTMSSGGVISGTPTGPNGTSNFSVTVTDSSNPKQTATQPLSITINLPPAPAISPTTLPNGNVGTAYSQTLTVTGGLAPYSWSVSSGTLPAGLTAPSGTAATAQITGTPTTAQSNVAFTIQVKDSSNPPQTGSQAYTVTINPPAPLSITTTALSQGTFNSAYSATITATGGVAPYAFSLDATSSPLPAGLALTTSNNQGVISGTPSATGTFSNIIVDVKDSETPPATAQKTYTLVIVAPPIVISPSSASLPGGTVGTAYSTTVTAAGGVPPLTFSLDPSSSPLPGGLSATFTSSGATFAGTPTTAGTFSNIIVDVKDSESPAMTQKMTYSITIAATGLSITTTSPLPDATLSSSYTTMVTASGGTPPYTWSLASGSTLPGVLVLTSGSPSATIAGTPNETGTYQFTLEVKDAANNTASGSFLITISGSTTLNCPTTVNLTLCGTYFYGVRGSNGSGGAIVFGGQFVANNSGNIISGVQQTNDSVAGYTTTTVTGGSYAMDSSDDGRGLLTLIASDASMRTFRLVLESSANCCQGSIEEFDSTGTGASGVIFGPGTPPFAQFPANLVLGFALEGVDSSGNRTGFLGDLQVGASGCDGASGSLHSPTGEFLVTNTIGTVNESLTVTGSCTAADTSTGVGTAQITISGGTPFASNTLNFTYIVVGGTAGLFVETDPIGTNQPILSGLATGVAPPSGGFNAASLGCPCLLVSQGTSNGNVSTGGPVASITRMVTTPGTGATGTLTGVIDENAAGTITLAGTWPYSDYSVDADGVGTITGTGSTLHFIITGSGGSGDTMYVLDESAAVNVGSFRAQNGLTIGSPGSPYVAGRDQGVLGIVRSTVHVLGVVTPSGATSGTLSGTMDVSSTSGNTVGVTVTGMYNTLDATGRGTGTTNLTTGSTSVAIIIYARRAAQFVILDVESLNPDIVGAKVQ